MQARNWIGDDGRKRGALRLDGFTWDLDGLVAELDAIDSLHPGAWRRLGNGEGWSQIQLIEPDGRGGERVHPALASCPKIRALADSFGVRVMAMTLAKLMPGGGVGEHRDVSGGVNMGVVRFHVPLRTDPGVEFIVDGEAVSMGAGETWHLDTTYPHQVHNRSEVERVHLIIDLQADESVRALLPEPDLRDHLHRVHFAAICVGKGLELAAREPKAAVDRVTRFARLRLLGQSVLTFESQPEDEGPPEDDVPAADSSPAHDLTMPSEIPSVFACPECGSRALAPADDLKPRAGVPWARAQGLRCSACAREFPFVNGVWVLWSDELAELIAAGAPDLDHAGSPDAQPDARAVKQANFTVYQQMSEAYGEHADASMSYVDQLLLLKAHAREILDTTEDKSEAARARPRVVVDVGCASGFALDIGSAGFDLRVGVDISLHNLEQVAARGHLAVLADAERLPFARGAVDLLTCFAAMHHFPDAEAFLRSAAASLRPGGVLLTAADPSRRNMHMGPLARAAWDFRKPVYRQLARFSSRFYLHTDTETQALNDLAEAHRTGGGFEPGELARILTGLGFDAIEIFQGVDRRKGQRYGVPSWQEFVLKGLSGRNPVLRENFVSLTTLSRKAFA